MPANDKTVGTAAAAVIANITERQIDHWCRTTAFSPAVDSSGSGSRREFTYNDCVRLAVIGAYSRHTDSSGTVSHIANRVASMKPPWEPLEIETPRSWGRSWAIKTTIYMARIDADVQVRWQEYMGA